MQYLISALNQEPKQLIKKMNIHADALIMNQITDSSTEVFCNTWKQDGRNITAWQMQEKGVGLSRNHLLMRGSAEILLFSDEDIVYRNETEKIVEGEFAEHPEADMILFNVKVIPERKTYENKSFARVHAYNCGRYPAYSIAVRREKLIRSGVMFSLLFGGGARYSNGEDSLFLRQFIQSGGRVYTSPKYIGEEIARASTWFQGYNEKFFYDRGYLYRYLYHKAAKLWAIRFLLTKKKVMCREIKPKAAYKLMKKGIRDAGR